jgi:hypothetical protein
VKIASASTDAATWSCGSVSDAGVNVVFGGVGDGTPLTDGSLEGSGVCLSGTTLFKGDGATTLGLLLKDGFDTLALLLAEGVLVTGLSGNAFAGDVGALGGTEDFGGGEEIAVVV